MAYDNNEKRNESIHSVRLKAGKRRTYFFDVRNTKSNDYFLTITESVKRFNDDGYDRHKIFIYKEDFNKFIKGITEVVDHIKVNLMPDFDFDAFNHEYTEEEQAEYYANLQRNNQNIDNENSNNINENPAANDNVDKW